MGSWVSSLPGRSHDQELLEKFFCRDHFLQRHHDLNFIHQVTVKFARGSKEGIEKTRATPRLRAAKQVGMEAGLFKARLDIPGGDIIEGTVDSRHSLIDLVITVIVAEEMHANASSAFSAIREAAHDARALCRTVAMVMARDALEKESAAARTELIRRPDLAAAF